MAEIAHDSVEQPARPVFQGGVRAHRGGGGVPGTLSAGGGRTGPGLEDLAHGQGFVSRPGTCAASRGPAVRGRSLRRRNRLCARAVRTQELRRKSYVEARIGLDLLRYRVRIWEQWLNARNSGRLPVVVPVVVYHGTATWRVSRQFADEVEDAPALRAYVPACVYHLIDLSGYRDDELQGAVMLHTALLTLKYIFRNELRERLPEILGLLRDLAQSSMGLDYVRTLLRYLAQAASIDRLSGDELRQAVTQTLSGGDELMLTIAEQWEQQAMERGIERGIEKGIEQGEARLLKQLLTWRFGALPAWVESQLAGAAPERLEAWAKRVLDAQTLDAVFVERS
ncbi:DUF4351 domain-containing protein [Candidatus Accumulibacter phosphatis]|uniref:DUF4351 domain-containing protein n=1 Tax=Candidatus Accumulibacter contiguus TaxID=2954381 RepID=A0ABX1TBA6_9PROT|nr:DUF4351 domain-containing protein [Candidatus Accumulibacter contiguus]